MGLCICISSGSTRCQWNYVYTYVYVYVFIFITVANISILFWHNNARTVFERIELNLDFTSHSLLLFYFQCSLYHSIFTTDLIKLTTVITV